MTEPDVILRREGRAGRITLNRPKALNALTHPQCLAIEAALRDWARDDGVALVILDAMGDRAFCAGGDIAQMYHAGRAGDFGMGRAFWRDEYRLNAMLGAWTKPIVSFMQGFVMGGGVGLGCHVPLRVVGDTTQMAMPECGIGMIPDVGGTALLAAAPGRSGEYLGLTGARMAAGDAIAQGFADRYLPEDRWPDAIAALCATGDVAALPALPAPAPTLPQAMIDRVFAGATVAAIRDALSAETGDTAGRAIAALNHNSPLSMALTLRLVRDQRAGGGLPQALAREFRVTSRIMQQGDFMEGVRAQIIDKDRKPHWRHAGPEAVTGTELDAMLAPLGDDELPIWEYDA